MHQHLICLYSIRTSIASDRFVLSVVKKCVIEYIVKIILFLLFVRSGCIFLVSTISEFLMIETSRVSASVLLTSSRQKQIVLLGTILKIYRNIFQSVVCTGIYIICHTCMPMCLRMYIAGIASSNTPRFFHVYMDIQEIPFLQDASYPTHRVWYVKFPGRDLKLKYLDFDGSGG